MTNAELLEYNKHREICQICIAVDRDILTVLDEWVDKLKVGPWTVMTMSNETVRDACLGGTPITEPFKYFCALAMYGNVQIEIVQNVYGPVPAQEFLARRGEGLQHFKEKISDTNMDARVMELEAVGFARTFSGGIKEDVFINFDTERSLGCALEIGNYADISVTKDMYFIYPRED
ncbi:hypothetical protein AGMMS49587_15530 [Spirochaetia bacterium]|nr:hypothetical protein AGMMS49587_15530 [Spirochaetia bacterium]